MKKKYPRAWWLGSQHRVETYQAAPLQEAGAQWDGQMGGAALNRRDKSLHKENKPVKHRRSRSQVQGPSSGPELRKS